MVRKCTLLGVMLFVATAFVVGDPAGSPVLLDDFNDGDAKG